MLPDQMAAEPALTTHKPLLYSQTTSSYSGDSNEPTTNTNNANSESNYSYLGVTLDNREKSRKTAEIEEAVTFSYPEVGMNGHTRASRGGDAESKVTESNSVILASDPVSKRRLTEEEVQQAKQLISQGMNPKLARAEVLGDPDL
jgi:hypothetical protein